MPPTMAGSAADVRPERQHGRRIREHVGAGGLRKLRADEQLRLRYEALKPRVIGVVRFRHPRLANEDLEELYNTAWAVVYRALEAGEEVRSLEGFLRTVTMRRAIDLETSRSRVVVVADPDVDPQLDALVVRQEEARHLKEALRQHLGELELQALLLCRGAGFTYAETAARLGVSERKLRKLIERAEPKLKAIGGAVEAGERCRSVQLLMRDYALGNLEQDSDRWHTAVEHLHGDGGCSGCRQLVLTLRGIAAVTPPVLPLRSAINKVLAGPRASHAPHAVSASAKRALADRGGRVRTSIRLGAHRVDGVVSQSSGRLRGSLAGGGAAGIAVKAAVTTAVVATVGVVAHVVAPTGSHSSARHSHASAAHARLANASTTPAVPASVVTTTQTRATQSATTSTVGSHERTSGGNASDRRTGSVPHAPDSTSDAPAPDATIAGAAPSANPSASVASTVTTGRGGTSGGASDPAPDSSSRAPAP